ncbi:MAG: aminopeptidase P family protein [Thermoplasmata archaeon]|nr:MAG: aminopeptidase P family protein [Thermoplasmata archaeon]
MNMNVLKRVEALREYMESRDIDASLIIDPLNQYYLTGFYAIIYSRPIMTIITGENTDIIVPALEEEHAKEEAIVDNIHVYYEHPLGEEFPKDPIKILNNILEKHSVRNLGVEVSKIPHSLAEALSKKFSIKDVGEKIAEMRLIKDKEEIELIEKAAELADIGVKESIMNTRPGMTELEIDAIGTKAILEAAASKHPGARVDLFVMSPSGPERTSMPHVFSISRKVKEGDVIIHSRQVGLLGYRAESERTYFVRKVSKEYAEMFEVMLEAQKKAIESIKPGVTCSQVDHAARSVISEAGYEQYFIHRTGHGLGLSSHEGPYLRFDSEQKLLPGMVVSVEPGFYIPKVGGFRHSDTVVVTDDGKKVLTKVPRDIDSLVV